MIQKYAIWIILILVIAFASYSAGVYQVSNRPIEVKTISEADKILKSIDEKLANLEKSNSINIDKLKGFKGTFSVNQNYTMKGDSAFRELLVSDIKLIIKDLKVSRCK